MGRHCRAAIETVVSRAPVALSISVSNPELFVASAASTALHAHKYPLVNGRCRGQRNSWLPGAINYVPDVGVCVCVRKAANANGLG